jgi:predicted PurR-regulated permease PerM
MSSKNTTKTKQGGMLLINMAAFVIIVAGMKLSSSILEPFLLSLFVAVIFISPFFWLRRKGIPNSLALLIIILIIIGIGTLFGTLIGTSIKDFSDNLPIYRQNLTGKTSAIFQWLSSFGIAVPDLEMIQGYFDPSAPLRLIGGVLGALGTLLSQTFLIMITSVFILLEASSFTYKLKKASNNPEQSVSNFENIHNNIKQYMSLKTLVSLGTGTAVTIWLLILGVDYPLLWGLLAFLLNYIPNIGSIIAAIPAVLMAIIQFGLLKALLVAGGYLVVNFVMGNILEPRIMGKGLGLSTLVVFLSLIFWGWVLGPIGMLLSVPLTMVIKIALDSREETRGIAIMLGSDEDRL